MRELSRRESLRLLSSVPVGRLVFTHHALPAIRPVNHIIEAERIIIGLTAGSALARAAAADGIIVAYEADALDMTQRTGWSVVVIGTALLETSNAALESYRQMIRPWLSGARADILSVKCEIVTGYKLSLPRSNIGLAVT